MAQESFFQGLVSINESDFGIFERNFLSTSLSHMQSNTRLVTLFSALAQKGYSEIVIRAQTNLASGDQVQPFFHVDTGNPARAEIFVNMKMSPRIQNALRILPNDPATYPDEFRDALSQSGIPLSHSDRTPAQQLDYFDLEADWIQNNPENAPYFYPTLEERIEHEAWHLEDPNANWSTILTPEQQAAENARAELYAIERTNEGREERGGPLRVEDGQAGHRGDLEPRPPESRAPNNECFAADTLIRTGTGEYKPIETVQIGDDVLAYDSPSTEYTDEFFARKVTAVQTREVEETLDFHGTIVTPGHVFLSGDGTFKKLADILEEDGTVVREDGTVVRARTNCPVGSEDDRAVPLRYTDPETGKAETVSIRAGAPFAADGDKVVTVLEAMRKIGYELGADGLFVDLDGNKVAAQWPWGRPEPTNLAENRVSFV